MILLNWLEVMDYVGVLVMISKGVMGEVCGQVKMLIMWRGFCDICSKDN